MTRPSPARLAPRLAALVLLVLAALLAPSGARAQATQAAQEEDTRTLAEYRLNEATLARFMAATRALAAASRAHPELAAQIERQSAGAPTIAGIAAAYDGHAPLRAAFQGAGITSREYVTFMLSVMQANLAAVLVKEDPRHMDHLPAGVSRENVEFYQKHEAALTRLGEEIRAAQQ